jgi:anaerobic magnesium-protoporphyrin IX monomethyl ester cyclase
MTKPKIVMIAPCLNSKIALEDLGICSITAFMREKGYNVKLMVLVKGAEDYQSIVAFQPDVIGITVYNHTIDVSFEICKKLRQLLPDAKLCLGGYAPTYNAAEMLEISSDFDFALVGEGELSFFELVSSLEKQSGYREIKGLAYRDQGSIIVNQKHEPIENLDALPFLSRDLIVDNKWKYGLITTSRGCTRNCFFCCGHDFWKSAPALNWRARSIANVCDEIEYLYHELHLDQFWIVDASFEDPGFNEPRMKQFAAELIKRKLKITYFVFVRAGFYKKAGDELMNLLVESGLCEVFIGTESVNGNDLKLLGKGSSVEDNINSLGFFRKYDIYPEIGFINFNPYSTFEGLRENAAFLEKYRFACFFRCLTFVRLYKGSRLYEKVKADGLLGDAKIDDDFCYSYVDKRIEKLSKYLQSFNDSLYDDQSDLGNRLFVFLRYYGDRLVHFKKRYSAANNAEIVEMTRTHIANLDKILDGLNVKVSEWFISLLDLAENAWDCRTADQICAEKLDRDYLREVLNQFDQEKLIFLRKVANRDRQAIMNLSE